MAIRLLLDTHVFLWWQANDAALSTEARDHIASAEVVFVSAASVWEAGVKAALGKLDLPDSITSGVEAGGFDKLSITFAHAECASALPVHHRDPFDRMLIAQSQVEDLMIVTHDRSYEPYDASILWT